jgi:hypothetical protein
MYRMHLWFPLYAVANVIDDLLSMRIVVSCICSWCNSFTASWKYISRYGRYFLSHLIFFFFFSLHVDVTMSEITCNIPWYSIRLHFNIIHAVAQNGFENKTLRVTIYTCRYFYPLIPNHTLWLLFRHIATHHIIETNIATYICVLIS